MKRRLFVARSLGWAAAAAAAGLAVASPGTHTSAPPAQGDRVIDLDLMDGERRRPVPVRLYLPQQATRSQPVPLVVFSHGLGGSRMGYRYLGSHWASEGLGSLHPQHVGSDESVWRGNPLDLLQRVQAAARDTEAQARVLDLRFALDQLLVSEHAPLIDVARVAVAGHSYGANTAMLVAGARVASAVLPIADLRDTRVRAAILISAPPLVGQGPVEQVLGAVSIPTLHVTSVDDTINIPGYRSTVDDRIAIFRAMNGSPRTLAVFKTGGHSIFTDRTTRTGPETSARIKGATRELCTLFLQQSLLNGPLQAMAQGAGVRPGLHDSDPAIRQWLTRHQDLLDRFVTPPARS